MGGKVLELALDLVLVLTVQAKPVNLSLQLLSPELKHQLWHTHSVQKAASHAVLKAKGRK